MFFSFTTQPLSNLPPRKNKMLSFSFTEKFTEMKECRDTYFITVVEDEQTNRVIGSASLVLEHKFIHNMGKVRVTVVLSIAQASTFFPPMFPHCIYIPAVVNK